MRPTPLIGVSSYPRAGKREAYALPSTYIDAIRAAGGIPVIFPPGEKTPARLLELVHGFVLSGGGDIAPARYQGDHHEMIYGVSEERDSFEMEIAQAALERPDRPLLCICRGMQVLNVVLGGTLHEHLPDLGPDGVDHRRPDRLPTSHPASIKPDSRLAEILDATQVNVCSWHHQAIDRIGRGLDPVAWAEDGIIEAVEHAGHPFCIGVQWHPEMQLDDPAQQRLFREFVRRCGG